MDFFEDKATSNSEPKMGRTVRYMINLFCFRKKPKPLNYKDYLKVQYTTVNFSIPLEKTK